MKRKLLVLIVLIFSVSLFSFVFSGCGKAEESEPDPHEGMVEIYDGYGWIWYTPIEGVETNELGKNDFEYINGTPIYTGDKFDILKGIDVSEHQLEINWSMVKNENLDFAYIRLGRRGYTEGGLFIDEYYHANLNGAKNAGLKTGVYFFSQATTVSEAIEEANFVLDNIKGIELDLPIAYDWEKVEDPTARTATTTKETITDCAIAFCETIKAAGYEPIIYYNRTSGYYRFDLARLTSYKVWFSLPCTPPDVTFPSFYYHIDMWQYSASENIPGIKVETDMNYIFIPRNATS